MGISMSDILYRKYKIANKVRLIELFAGVGTQAMALRDLGVDFEHYRVVEFDSFAIKSYNAIHGTDFRATDIRNISGSDLGITDTDKYTYLMTYSFPCFTGDTLVLTNSGYKEIKDISVGEYVLTHDNTYEKVTDRRMTGKKTVYKIKGMAMDEIKCAPEHKFYVRKMVRHYPTYENGKRGQTREFLEPEWKSCCELDKSYYLGISINGNEIFPKWDGVESTWSDGRKPRKSNHISSIISNHSFWWIIGRYVGDGWAKKDDGIIISSNKKRVNDLFPHLRNCGFHYTVSDERTTTNVIISSKELAAFVRHFGKGAKNKEIPWFVFDLPIPFVQSFLDGYVSADGCFIESQGIYKAVSISRKLVYGLSQLVAKAYKAPYRIYRMERPKTCIIEGRTVNQNDTYELVWKTNKKKQDRAFYEDGHIWFPIQSIEEYGIEDVYDISVENAHSFTANGVIVHNCQDLSTAGLMNGMKEGSGTRSALLWEVKRLLEESDNLPQVLVMENVPAVHSEKNKVDFQRWIDYLESKGYFCYWKDLNARNYGVPQNRNRCFMVSLLGRWSYRFPEPIPLEMSWDDYLEPEVGEEYYIKSEKAQHLIDNLLGEGKAVDAGEESVGVGAKAMPCDLSTNDTQLKSVANCITAREDRGICARKSMGTGVLEVKGEEVIGPVYTGSSDEFQLGISPIARTVKAQLNDLGVIVKREDSSGEVGIKQVGNIVEGSSWENPQTGRVYDVSGCSPTLNTCQGGQRVPKIICAMRGRNPENPSDRTVGSPTQQRLEPNSQGICNMLTSVQKDNLVLENAPVEGEGLAGMCVPEVICIDDTFGYEDEARLYTGTTPALRSGRQGLKVANREYRVRNLTALECWRLMDYTDEDYRKAASVNSRRQLYIEAGNGIVKRVLMAIFGQLFAGKEDLWKQKGRV